MRFLFSLIVLFSLHSIVAPDLANSQVLSWTHTFKAPLSKAVTINPRSNGQVLYTATDDSIGIFKSYDGGNTWMHLKGGDSPIANGAAYVTQFYIVPVDTSVLLAGSQFGLHRSTDGGYTWTHPIPGLKFEGQGIFSVHDKTLGRQVIYAGEAESAVLWRSLDTGATWDSISRIAGASELCTIAVMPGTDSVFLAGSEGGTIARSEDKGKSWFITLPPDPNRDTILNLADVPNIVFDPGIPSVVYASLYQVKSEHFVKSTDGGLNWDSLSLPPNTWTVSASPEGFVWVGRFSAFDHDAPHFLMSLDRGKSWLPEHTFDEAVDLWSSSYDAASHTIAVAGNGLGDAGNGVFVGKLTMGVQSNAVHERQLVGFPNPVYDFLTLESATDRAQISVYSVDGRRVMQAKLPANGVIDMRPLAAGVYRIVENDGTAIRSLMIVKQ